MLDLIKSILEGLLFGKVIILNINNCSTFYLNLFIDGTFLNGDTFVSMHVFDVYRKSRAATTFIVNLGFTYNFLSNAHNPCN